MRPSKPVMSSPEAMHPYSPLKPIEPTLSTNAFTKPTSSPYCTGHNAFEPFRTPGSSSTRLHCEGVTNDRRCRMPMARLPIDIGEAAQQSHGPVVINDLPRSEGARYPVSKQMNSYGSPAPPNCSYSGVHFSSSDTMRAAPFHHRDQQNVHPPRPNTSTHYAPPSHHQSYNQYSTSTLQQYPHSQYQPTLRSESDSVSVSSPASSTSQSLSLASSHRTRSSRTSPPNTAANPQTPVPPPSSPYTYTLKFRQQPLAARACGQGERDRRTIDPPPILELRITDSHTGDPASDHTGLFALSCNLIRIHANGAEDTTTAPPKIDRLSSRPLTGSTISSPYEGKDEHGRAGTFFVFADLSCRDPGRYKLRFQLTRLDPMRMAPGTVHPNVSATESDGFVVFVAKDFPGMRASSSLLKALRMQGLNAPLKKGRDGQEDEQDEEDQAEVEEEEVEANDEQMDGENDGSVGRNGRMRARGKKRKQREPED